MRYVMQSPDKCAWLHLSQCVGSCTVLDVARTNGSMILNLQNQPAIECIPINCYGGCHTYWLFDEPRHCLND
ncbi:hypothetical protein BHE74_00019631 [Ensete ventricosum]|nr:hypothetical protein GW17_00038074 [Ensete ventricosum]RWW72551.1 hypothetical protein BHE74_00019631 [Ensete ventricosum]